MLESALLATPQKIGGQAHHLGCFQFVDGTTKQRLIEAYYSLDGVLCREILGKKLSSRLRKELDEISEKTNLHLKSCRRQVSISSTLYSSVFCTNVVSAAFFLVTCMLHIRGKSCRNVVCTKNSYVKCWWNWHQFDNIKRVYKVIEEMPGHYVKNIESQVLVEAHVRQDICTLYCIEKKDISIKILFWATAVYKPREAINKS